MRKGCLCFGLSAQINKQSTQFQGTVTHMSPGEWGGWAGVRVGVGVEALGFGAGSGKGAWLKLLREGVGTAGATIRFWSEQGIEGQL